MGKIKQGILGGFKGKVGTVIGSSWNGISYMKGRPLSQKDPKTAAQIAQRDFFSEIQDLVGQLSVEQLAFLFPSSPKGMTRRNAIVQQLSEAPIIEADGKHVDLTNLKTLGNAPTAALPEASVIADGDILTISWNGASDWRTAHADEYPTVFVANVTKKKVFLINSPVAFGAAGEWSFIVGLSAYGEAFDTFIELPPMADTVAMPLAPLLEGQPVTVKTKQGTFTATATDDSLTVTYEGQPEPVHFTDTIHYAQVVIEEPPPNKKPPAALWLLLGMVIILAAVLAFVIAVIIKLVKAS